MVRARVFLIAITLIVAQLSLAGPAAANAGKRCSPEGRERVTSAGTLRCVRDGSRGLIWMTVAPASATTLPPVTTTTPSATVPGIRYTTTTIGTAYTVTYNGNGNSSGYAPRRERVLGNVSFRIASNSGNLARTGYRFGGWCTEQTEVGRNCAGVQYLPFEIYTKQTDVTLYALWIGLTCATGGTCQLGDIGPGGGRVFYVATTPFASFGSFCNLRCFYLEYAPRDPANFRDNAFSRSWASNYEYVDPQGTRRNNQSEPVNGAMAREIGSGYQNSRDIAFTTGNTAATSAAVFALEYQSKGWTDWHLPSLYELEALRNWVYSRERGCRLDRGGVNGCSLNKESEYWSSTQKIRADGRESYRFGPPDRSGNPLQRVDHRVPAAWSVALHSENCIGCKLPGTVLADGHVMVDNDFWAWTPFTLETTRNVLPIRAFGRMYQPGS